MIHYETASWLDTLSRWDGTVLQNIWGKVLIAFSYVSIAYILELIVEQNFGCAFDHSKILGGTLSFLLVFRANTSYERYWHGRKCCSEFFANLRDLAMLSCALFKGGHGQYVWNRRQGDDGFCMERKAGLDDIDDRRTSNARADIVRWSLALGVAFRLHMRCSGSDGYIRGAMDPELKWKVNWDRMRLRGLMSQTEFEQVEKSLHVQDTSEERRLLWKSLRCDPEIFQEAGLRPPPPPNQDGEYEVSLEPTCRQLFVILNFLCQSIRVHANETYGYKERFLPNFIKISTMLLKVHDRVNQAMTTPLPLPYVNLVRTLLIGYLASAPFFINYEDGLWANVVMPTVAALALLGIDQIGTELENPFGDDHNDIDVQLMIMTLEREMVRMLEFAGDSGARHKFIWLPVPQLMQGETKFPFCWYLQLKREACHVKVPRMRGYGGVQVKHVRTEEQPRKTEELQRRRGKQVVAPKERSPPKALENQREMTLKTLGGEGTTVVERLGGSKREPSR